MFSGIHVPTCGFSLWFGFREDGQMWGCILLWCLCCSDFITSDLSPTNSLTSILCIIKYGKLCRNALIAKSENELWLLTDWHLSFYKVGYKHPPGQTGNSVTNLFKYLCARNNQNRMQFDKVIAKTKGASSLPHNINQWWNVTLPASLS